MKRMEGGRVNPEFVGVNDDPEEKVQDTPLEITEFRHVLDEYKDNILNSLTPTDMNESPEIAQSMTLIDNAAAKIQRLANILKAILSDTSDEIDYTNIIAFVLTDRHLEDERNQLIDDVDSIFKVFNHKKVFLDKLRKDPSLRDDCLHYLNNDLEVHMFSLKNQSIN
jgi:argonaute-like protein implicated in RNA metabolism and viral defense